MKRKILIGLVSFMIVCSLVGCGTTEVNTDESTLSDGLIETKEEMETFPSYDWGAEDGSALAYVAANTGGTDDEKQQAVINVLHYIWYDNSANLSIVEYVDRNYDGYAQVTSHDYDLVSLIKQGKWYSDCRNDTETLYNVTVDMRDSDDGGCVGMYSKVQVQYYLDKITYISIDDPTVLYFAIPDEYTDGLVMMSGEQLEQIKSYLNDGDIDSAMEILNELYALEDCPT